MSAIAATVLCALALTAASVDPVVVWQAEEGKTFAGWSDRLDIAAADLGDAEAGDMLTVHVSAIDAATSWPQVHLRQYGGKAFDPAKSQSLKNKTAPCEVMFELDDAAAQAAADKGLSIAGIGFTIDGVTLAKKERETPPEEMIEVEVTKTLWSGEQVVSGWSGARCSLPRHVRPSRAATASWSP